MRAISYNHALKLVLGSSLLLVSCGGSAAPAPPGVIHMSGSRLRARITDAGGGARRFDGWYDTTLDSPCTVRLAEDGVLRCMPMADSVVYPPVYADAACANPVITYVNPDQAAPFFAADTLSPTSSPPRACGADIATLARQASGTLVSAWRIGARQPAPPAIYARDPGGVCVQQPPDAGLTGVYPVEHVTPGELVGVRDTRVEPRGASLAVQIFEHDDGSSVIGSTFDVTTKQPCWPSWNYGLTDDYRCYPGLEVDTCVPGATNSCVGDLIVGAIDFCGPPPLTRVGAASCAVADPAEVPSLDSGLQGTGRVRVVVTRASDDERPLLVNPGLFQDSGRYRRGPFFDTERQLPCDATTVDDGTLRCLTTDVIISDAYSDATCTTPIAEKLPADTCAAHGPQAAPRFAVGGYTQPRRLYALGAEVAPGAAYYLNVIADPPSCEPLQLQNGWYELTPADANIFATLTTEIE